MVAPVTLSVYKLPRSRNFNKAKGQNFAKTADNFPLNQSALHVELLRTIEIHDIVLLKIRESIFWRNFDGLYLGI